MSAPDPLPGEWPDSDTLRWMDRMARHYLGPDYAHLAGEVVSRVSEAWRFREDPNNNRARMETRLRSVSLDIRKSEQRRGSREQRYVEERPPTVTDEHWRIEVIDALERQGLHPDARRVIEMVAIQGRSIEDVVRASGLSRYRVRQLLIAAARALGIEPHGS